MDDAEFEKLLNVPSSPLTLIASKEKNIRDLLIFLLVAAFGLAMILNPSPNTIPAINWLILVSFGGLSLGTLLMIVFPNSITLDHQGFKVKTLRREDTYMWKNVSGFVGGDMLKPDVAEKEEQAGAALQMALNIAGGYGRYSSQFKLGKIKMVMFDTGLTDKRSERFRKTSGYSNLIPASTFGLTVEQLAQLMNQWRERVLNK